MGDQVGQMAVVRRAGAGSINRAFDCRGLSLFDSNKQAAA
jgi:hypothetical protein